jgi:hypothetical protein
LRPSFPHLVFQTKNVGLGVVLLSCLVYEVKELPSPGIELRTLFSWKQEGNSYVLFLISRKKLAKFGANRYIRSFKL